MTLQKKMMILNLKKNDFSQLYIRIISILYIQIYMFEKLLEQLINNLLGKYIQELDAKQLSVGIWKGNASIQNVKLKPEAFQKLDLPFVVKSSQVGKLAFIIPWHQISAAPIQVTLDELRIVLTPIPKQEWSFQLLNGEMKLQIAEAYKKKILDKINEGLKSNQKEGVMSRVMQRVIENLKLDIKNIHISFLEKDYSFGVKLDSLQCFTINEDGVENFLDRTTQKTKTLVKKISIGNFGFYWNSENEQNDQNIFSISLESRILFPPKEVQPDQTATKLVLTLQTLEFQLSKKQTQQSFQMMEFVQSYRKNLRRERKANQAKLEERADLNVKFNAFMARVPLDKTANQALEQEEYDQLIESCKLLCPEEMKNIIGEVVKEQQQIKMIEDTKQKKAQNTKEEKGFFGNWFGGGKKKKQPQNVDNQEIVELNQEELSEIEEYLARNFSEDESKLQRRLKGPPDQLYQQLQLNLQKCKIILINDDFSKIEFNLDTINLIMSKLNNDTQEYQFLLGDLKVIHHDVEDRIVILQKNSSEANEEFLTVKTTAINVNLKLKSSTFYYSKNFYPLLVEMVDIEMKDEELKDAAFVMIEELQIQAAQQLQNAIVEKKERLVVAELEQCYMILPIPDSEESWVLNSGYFRMNSKSKSRVQMELQNINFTHCQTLEAIRQSQQLGNQRQQQYRYQRIIEDFNISVDFIYQSKDSILNIKDPSVLVNGTISTIKSQINPAIYQQLIKIKECFKPKYKPKMLQSINEKSQSKKEVLIANAQKVIDTYLTHCIRLVLYINNPLLGSGLNTLACLVDPTSIFTKSQKMSYLMHIV